MTLKNDMMIAALISLSLFELVMLPVNQASFGKVVRGCSKELRSRVRTPRLVGLVQLLASQLVFCTQSTHVFPLCLPAPSS